MERSDERRKSLAEELEETRLNLMHASRLASTGQLLASVLHEIQQPLIAVRLRSAAGRKMLNETHIPREKLEAVFDDIGECVEFASGIVSSLRALSGKQRLELLPVEVNEALSEVIRLAEIEAQSRGVTMRVELAPRLPWIQADRVSLEHAVLDLIVNAIEATEGRPERIVTIESLLVENNIEVHVSDSGAGIPADCRAKLFHAFFTTKPHGTGLGLAIARSIVEAHGGSIWAEDDTGTGASFRIRLPTVRSSSK